jgi:hypothetical protein
MERPPLWEISTNSRTSCRLLGNLIFAGPEFGNIVSGAFTPVLAKHTKSFNLIDTLAVGVDRIQRSFEPMRRQVEIWRQAQISDDRAKLILYRAFVDGELEAPKTLLPDVHRLYFQPEYEEFSPRTMWSLSNAFTSAFKELDPIPVQGHSQARSIPVSAPRLNRTRSLSVISQFQTRNAPFSTRGARVMFQELMSAR